MDVDKDLTVVGEIYRTAKANSNFKALSCAINSLEISIDISSIRGVTVLSGRETFSNFVTNCSQITPLAKIFSAGTIKDSAIVWAFMQSDFM